MNLRRTQWLLGAKASLELAKANHARNEEVVKENLIPQTEADLSAANLKQAEADVQSADAQVARAKRDLERTHILAPFDGRVRQRLVGLGQLVGAGIPPLANCIIWFNTYPTLVFVSLNPNRF